MTAGSALASAEPTDEVLISRKGVLGHIRLNRPRALNSLTLDMVRAMARALDEFERDPGIALVLLEGAGERGLCAGGDIRAIYDSGRRRDGHAERFLREEYALNARVAAYPKPYVAVMDGIVMGGGVGVSAHASHRVVTERTRLAMPEAAIGFFPDVGATWLLPRAPGEAGTYIGLTGEPAGAADALYARLADAFVLSADLPALHDALAALPPSAVAADVSRALQAHSREPDAGPLQCNRALIDGCMAFDNVEEIWRALDSEGSDFAKRASRAMSVASPTGLKLTLRLLRLGRSTASLEECLVREYRAACHALRGHDFYEGIRAAVIDKDKSPRWSPARLEDVNDALMREYFRPAPEEAMIFPGRDIKP
jgi:enoyl-CoA hydratase